MTFRPSAADFLRGTDARRGTSRRWWRKCHPARERDNEGDWGGGKGIDDHRRRNIGLFYESNDQEAGRELEAATEYRECSLPKEKAMEPCLSTFVFPFFLTYGRKREEMADEGDPQQDRRTTRYAAKAWSVDKIASSWNEDRLLEKRIEKERGRYEER